VVRGAYKPDAMSLRIWPGLVSLGVQARYRLMRNADLSISKVCESPEPVVAIFATKWPEAQKAQKTFKKILSMRFPNRVTLTSGTTDQNNPSVMRPYKAMNIIGFPDSPTQNDRRDRAVWIQLVDGARVRLAVCQDKKTGEPWDPASCDIHGIEKTLIVDGEQDR
jgi:hypothetical protein